MSLPEAPEDLGAFWREAIAEANAVRLDYHRSLRNEFDLPGFVVETMRFATIGGGELQGWLAYPPGARRLPGFVWIPPYGRESLPPNEYGVREGFVSLSFNFFGHGPFYREAYVPARGYFAEGAASPDTWIFRRMLQDAAIAVRVLEAQVEVDEDRIAAMGMSQGGGMAIWLGAWCETVRAVCADMPFLGRVAEVLQSSVYRYPLRELADFMEELPLGRERVFNTLAYFDTVHQAAHCRKPTQVSLGLRDPACQPDSVRAIFDALPVAKRLIPYPGGHDWDPAMIENNRQWLLENLGP